MLKYSVKDYYQILGVDRQATADDIKSAYRRLASKHHPDRGGDTQQFQEIQEAYATLSDDAKRKQYDQPPGQFHFQQSGIPPEFAHHFGDIFGHVFRHQIRPQARVQVHLNLKDLATGGKRNYNISGQLIEIDIPLGIESGQEIRYPNIGPNNHDLVITYVINPHPVFQRQGLNLVAQRGLDFWDLILGCELEIENLQGNQLAISVPANTRPGTQMRLRAQGLPNGQGNRGDIILNISAELPRDIPSSIIEEIKRIRSK